MIHEHKHLSVLNEHHGATCTYMLDAEWQIGKCPHKTFPDLASSVAFVFAIKPDFDFKSPYNMQPTSGGFIY
jgi:hypothetical protein